MVGLDSSNSGGRATMRMSMKNCLLAWNTWDNLTFLLVLVDIASTPLVVERDSDAVSDKKAGLDEMSCINFVAASSKIGNKRRGK